ncbi:DUF1877 family protein [Streptomyces sp. T-3]|nr:DUF1877 family protein [Streptomyces sp. T-3]
MGFYLGLTRHDYAEVEALLAHPDGPAAGRKRLREQWTSEVDPEPEDRTELRTLEEDYISRTWDALHVLLTGCPNDDADESGTPSGELPARNVIMGGLVLTWTGETSPSRLNNLLLLTPDEVHAVDTFLRSLDCDALIEHRYRLLVDERPYSFGAEAEPGEDPATGNMVQSGLLAGDFETLRAFYARAAAAGNAVIKDIS